MISRTVMTDQWNSLIPLVFGYQKCPPGHNFGPAIREHYLLHYVFSGTGTFYKAGEHHSVSPGDIFVIHPGEVTTYTASEENPWHYCWLEFRLDGTPECLLEPVIRQPPVRHVFENLVDAADSDTTSCRIYALAYELLYLLSQTSGHSVQMQSNYAEYAKAHLENAYMMSVSIEDIAKALHIDRRHLTKVFRQTYGVSPQTFLMELRLRKAREFLEKGYHVTDSAAMAGFSDLSNFSRKYKQFYGITPVRQRSKK